MVNGNLYLNGATRVALLCEEPAELALLKFRFSAWSETRIPFLSGARSKALSSSGNEPYPSPSFSIDEMREKERKEKEKELRQRVGLAIGKRFISYNERDDGFAHGIYWIHECKRNPLQILLEDTEGFVQAVDIEDLNPYRIHGDYSTEVKMFLEDL